MFLPGIMRKESTIYWVGSRPYGRPTLQHDGDVGAKLPLYSLDLWRLFLTSDVFELAANTGFNAPIKRRGMNLKVYDDGPLFRSS